MKKLLATGVAGALLVSTVFTGTAGAAGPAAIELEAKHEHGGLDAAIINEDRLIESLINQGMISADATQAEKQGALASYIALKGKKDTTVTEADPIAPQVKAAQSKKHSEFKGFTNGLLNGNGKKTGQYKKQPDPVKESTYTGPVRKDKVLVLSVEFSDYAHNNIKPIETDNYYKDYTLGHYEDMIFGANGYAGPNGENFVSMARYYREQSGGSYSVEGKAYGWLKVPGTAKFYGADKASGGHDNVAPGGSKQLVKDVYKAALAAGIPLENYDFEDPHDLDGDGNLLEKDGLVDHLMIIHAGVGQEAGGGSLGNDAIWSHRSAVFYDLDGLGAGKPGFYDYTMMPEDGAVGVFAHEYGHDLGLPDEYDTQYTGVGEPVSYWSIMSSGSWAGKIGGTEPTGFSPWGKSYFQSVMGGNWTKPTVVNWEDVSTRGTQFLLDQANSPLGQNNQAIQVNLPQKKKFLFAPATGSYAYSGGIGDEIDTTATTTVDLTGKTSATLSFDSWYQIEENWDMAFVQVSTDGKTWNSLSNANTTSDVVDGAYPTILESLPGFTGTSNGWTKQSFDLSAYAGKQIQLRFRYITDWGTSETGFYVDNVNVTADGATLIEDGAETATSSFELNGFNKFDGNSYSNHYYLLEWRNHQGVDAGLANIRRGQSLMSFDGGLLVWYVDPSYTDNWTGVHPGDGYLGVVDARPNEELFWSTGAKASTRYLVRDAAFSLKASSALDLFYPTQQLVAPSQPAVSLFDDSRDFSNTFEPHAGRNVTNYGLKVRVNGTAADGSVGAVVLYK